MKPSLVSVVIVAVVCSITQPGFAGDYLFRLAGVEVKKLPAGVEKAEVRCKLTYQTAAGGLAGNAKKELPVTQTPDGRGVLSGPFELAIYNVDEKGVALSSICELWFFKSNAGWITPSSGCDPTTATAASLTKVCIDGSFFNRHYFIKSYL